nr:hypothetical protein [Tanacetum cinerariifolium]
EQEAADTIKSLKESRRTKKRQLGTRGSDEGTCSKPGVLDESTIVSATSGEGAEHESEYLEEDLFDDEKKDDKDGEGDEHIRDTQDYDDEDDETESDEEDIYKYKIRMRIYEDEQMKESDVAKSKKGEVEIVDKSKSDAEKSKEGMDDPKKAELPSTSSSLSVSSGFGDQFPKMSSDTFIISNVKDTTEAEISSLTDVTIQSEVPHIQSPSALRVHVFVISEPKVLDYPSAAPVTTLSPPSVFTTPAVITIPHLQQQTTPIPTPPIT